MTEQTIVPLQTHVPSLRITTFGPFTLERRISSREEPLRFLTLEGKALGDRPGTLLALLKFLLSSPNRHATKAALMEEQWPGVDEESAQRRFNTAKSVLSKLLRTSEGTNLLLETPDGLGLYLAPQSEIEVDADTFEAAVQEASLAERTSNPDHQLLLWQYAYDLRRGDYLPNDLGSPWTETRRFALDTLYALCVQQLASLHRARGQLAEAERILRAYWSTHLTDEEALFRLMELLASQGERLAALRCYKISARALRDELDVAPSEPLRVLAEQLRKHGFSQGIAATTGQAALPLWSSPSNFLLPEPLVTSWPHTTEGVGGMPSYGGQVAHILHLIMSWPGRALHCDQLQKLLNLELERWNDMTSSSSDHAMLISRRGVLAGIAALPVAVSVAILKGQRAPIVLETFLPECTASITVCWHLMKGNGISIVAEHLPHYLPALEMLAQQPSRYQKTASKLAAQGCLLMNLVALHHLKFSLSEVYCRRAEQYSNMAEDQTLYITVLTMLAFTLYYENKLAEAVSYWDRAIMLVLDSNNQITPLLKSKVLVQAAVSYARHGQMQKALRCLNQAHEIFPTQLLDEPVYVSTDYGMFSMLACEGQTYGHLGELALDRMMPKRSKVLYTQAQNTFAKLEQLDPTIITPERIRVEIINQQAATAIAQGDMELFGAYFQAGVQGAKALGSDKRMQEAITNWKAARQRWPHEQRMLELADVLL